MIDFRGWEEGTETKRESRNIPILLKGTSEKFELLLDVLIVKLAKCFLLEYHPS